MRFAIICASYARGRSYQENVWAEEFARRGHTVRVITSGKKHSGPTRVEIPGGRYEELFVPTRFLPSFIFLSKHVGPAVREFNPDMVWLSSNLHFALDMARDPHLRNVPMANFFSENLSWHEFDWRKKGIPLKARLHAITYYLLRTRSIRTICRRSDLINASVPQGLPIVLRAFPPKEREAIQKKMVSIPLGYDPSAFEFSVSLRDRVRQELGVGERDILLVASSRMEPDKLVVLLAIVDAVHKLANDNRGIRAAVVGFSNTPESDRVLAAIKQGPHPDAFITVGWADRSRLNELYNGADMVIFGRSSISAQEALATGVKVILPSDGSLSHLIEDKTELRVYQPDDSIDLANKLQAALTLRSEGDPSWLEASRHARAASARRFGYDQIIDRVIGELQLRLAASGRSIPV